MKLSVAVVGSGPSGFYAADSLLKAAPDCQVDLIERLPSPFGLVRGGVAPDHQSTKRVWRSYERIALDPRVRFYGNVALDRDVTLAGLRETYDAVVLAVGAPRDRPLDVPGGKKAGVVGSAAFVGWFNGHPDFTDLAPNPRGLPVAVIGNGNVALDIARVVVKSAAEMADSDLAEHAAEAIQNWGCTDIHVIGRRGPEDAKFSTLELKEIGDLADAAPRVHCPSIPDSVATTEAPKDDRRRNHNLEVLRGFAAALPDARPKNVHFHFNAIPVEVLGVDQVGGLRLERSDVVAGRAVGTGETFELACGLVIPAIGYLSEEIVGAPLDRARGWIANQDGRVSDGVYVVGWAMRGPTGVIGTSKRDGQTVADHILADIQDGSHPGRAAFERLLEARQVRWVTYPEWQRIDAAEIDRAAPSAPRRKFVTVADMLAVLD